MLEVLCSVVLGDADKEDIIDLLKRDKVDSLESLTRILTRGEPMAATEAARRPHRRSRKNRTASAPNVHQVPEVPVLLNGTLYDPEDVRRFDGQALHFVPAANREYLLA